MRMGSTTAQQALSDLAVHDADILMETAKASAARRALTWPPRPITPLIRALLWALRIYVILMLAVVVVQLARLRW